MQKLPAFLTLSLLMASIPASSQTLPEGVERIQIPVGDMIFDALAAGPEDGELVLLLHGFPQSSYSYRTQLPVLAAQGFRAVAPDQRGYSAGARPSEVSAYAMGNLVGDVLGMATALGAERFHLVGHDWGGAVAWVVGSAVPGRVRSLVALSTPHVSAFGRALAEADGEQARASSYFTSFRAEGSERRFLENDAAEFKELLGQWGSMSEADINVYLEVLGTEEALGAALNWYRAGTGGATATTPPPPSIVTVPTLYVWSTNDAAFTRATAEATEEFVTGPYRFEVLEGVSHWIAEEAPERLSELLVEHLQQWREH